MVRAEKRTLSVEATLRDRLSRGVKSIERSLARFSGFAVRGFQRVGRALLNVRTLVAGLATGFVALQGIRLVRNFADQADELNKLARGVGDTVENLSELQTAFGFAGISGEQFKSSIRGLFNAVRQAQQGNAVIAAGFDRIGVSLTDLQRLGPSQLFEKIAAGLEQIETQQGRLRALGPIVPENFVRLQPLLGQGLANFQKLIVDARRAGATVTQEQARLAEELNDSFLRVETAIGRVGRALLESFGPRVAGVLNSVARAIADNADEFAKIASVIGAAIVEAVDLAITGIIELVGVIESIPGVSLLDGTREAELERELKTVENMIAQGLDFTGALAKQQSRLERELQGINDGLVGKLRDLQSRVRDEFAKSIDAVRDGAVAPSAEEVAAATGMPTPEQAKEYAENLRAAMANAFRNADAPAQGGEFASVLRQTPTQAAGLDIGEPEGQAALDRQRLALLQQIGSLASDLIPVQDALADIERQSVVLQLTEAKDKGVINAQELGAAVAFVNEQFERLNGLVTGGSFFEGFQRGVRGVVQQWTDLTAAAVESAQTLLDGGLNGITDALGSIISGAKSTKDAFKDLARSVLQDLARVIARLVVVQTLNSILGLETGGVTTQPVQGTAPIKAFARGGIADSPTLALFGEGRNSEAFVPLPDNRSIPVTFTDGGQRGGNVVQFTVYAMDSRDVQRMLMEQQGTLQRIFTNQATNKKGMRDTIQTTAA